MSSVYFEQRPAYIGETVTLTATIDGSGSIAGWTFTGALYNPAGNEVVGAVAVAILSAAVRTITVTVDPMTTAGNYILKVTRTDDSLGLVVVRGVIEVTDPTVP